LFYKSSFQSMHFLEKVENVYTELSTADVGVRLSFLGPLVYLLYTVDLRYVRTKYGYPMGSPVGKLTERIVATEPNRKQTFIYILQKIAVK
jgi:hypothetical protein